MDLHEYQSKLVMRSYGLPVLAGHLCHSPGEAESAADQLGGGICVVKAQVHAGGRGKAGGVKVVKSSSEARDAAQKIIGMRLVTPQTGAKGKLVRKVYVESGCKIAKEYYLSILVDRAAKGICIVASAEGGTEIEELAHNHPEKILKFHVDPKVGFQKFQGQLLATKLGISGDTAKQFNAVLGSLYKMFVERDLTMMEINPLVVTSDGQIVVLDAKCSVDDSALFRQTELRSMLDYDELDSKDLRAMKANLSYVALDGNIGCMVNGAGLAMATMDIIKMFGGNPANFLDVGGGASKETVTEAFRILLSDEQVKGILVNIFGGIMKCDVIAGGIIEAAKELGVKVPLVVRLQGTNVELGRKMLAESGLKIQPADTMDDAAQKIVAAVK
jgi:succinyl-CoA synthetase beta subunit